METALPVRESPEHVQLSLAAAIALGLESGSFSRDFAFGGINLLERYSTSCAANCQYCGLARQRPARGGDKSFIRVEWPVFPTDLVVERMARLGERITRVCLSMVTHPRAYADAVTITRTVRSRVAAPYSLLCAPNLMSAERLREMRDLGVDMIGIGLDAATPPLFERRRGRRVRGPLEWDQYWEVIRQARQIFGPWRVNCHVVVGLGETDAELLNLIFELRSRQVHAFLFSFYPEPDSALAHRPPPPLVRWRRLQLVKHLIEAYGLRREQVRLEPRTGRIAGLQGVSPGLVEEALMSGVAFMTDGCEGPDGQVACTRPYGSYRPSQPFRDYPFRPEEADRAEIRRQLRLDTFEVRT